MAQRAPTAGARGLRGWWRRLRGEVSWTPPTSTEIGTVAKSGLAAGLSWAIALGVTGVSAPVLAPLTAAVVVQVSVRASLLTALQRSAAVVIGVLIAVAIGDNLALNGFTVGLLVAVTLAVAQLVLRLPPGSARQVPISILVVLTAVSTAGGGTGWTRAVDTFVGAGVGVVVSLVLPASRLVDARQTLGRLADSLSDVLDAMGNGLQQPWSTDQTEGWRRQARTTRDRLVSQAAEAAGNGRETARWNVRDRRHIGVISSYEHVMPRLERTAIGVSVISRGLDDHARLSGTTHAAMPAMGALLVALSRVVSAVIDDVLDAAREHDLAAALSEVRARRARCVVGASRRARSALEGDESPAGDVLQGEWLSYAAILVQVDRLVRDLSAPLPA